jgi:serine/threonine protein kinase
MAVAEVHPSVEELAAFTLGSLDEETQGSIEAHVAACSSCQEQAAIAPNDTLLELLRSVHARPAALKDTVTEAGEQAATPDTLPPTQAERPMPVPPEPVEIPPELVGHPRYRVRRLIGVGGMGAVYEAEHLVMDRPVAIKVINRAFTANAAAVERFRREVRAASRLSHPHIVTAHDAEQTGDALFLVTEYVHGISLGRLVRERGPLPIAEACDYIRQAAMGLQHAHERGMVHRDIKPDNLMRVVGGWWMVDGDRQKTSSEKHDESSETSSVTNRQSPTTNPPSSVTNHQPPTTNHFPANADQAAQIKILDFGLAVLAVERRNGLTAEDAIVGTPEYMAPEQAEDSHAADIRSDIYSLGCSLYVLLTGNVPYPAETPLLKILAHRDRPLPSLRTVRPDAPPELAAVLARMMAKKPQDRYQTPGEVAAALAPFVGHVSNVSPGKARWKRAPRYLLAASLLAALLLAGGVVYRIQTDKGELVIKTESDDVEVVIKQSGEQIDIIDTKTKKSIRLRSGEYDLELKDAPGLKLDLEKATLKRGKETVATIERIGKPSRAVNEAQKTDIWVVQRVLSRGPLGYGHLTAAARDGKFFAADVETGSGARVVVWDGETGKELYRFDGWIPGFTPDGKRLVYTCPVGLAIRDLKTGETLSEIAQPEGSWLFSILPDDRHVLHWSPTHKLRLGDLKAGKWLQTWPGEADWAFTDDGRILLVKPAGEKSYRAWDVQKNEPSDEFVQLRKYREIVFLPGNKRAKALNSAGKWCLVDVADGKWVTLPDRAWGHYVVAFAGGTQFDHLIELIGYGDGKIRLFDGLTQEVRAVFQLPDGETIPRQGTLNLSIDGRYACVETNRAIYLLRLPDPPANDKP